MWIVICERLLCFCIISCIIWICLGWEWWVAWVLLSPQEPILCKLQWSHYKGEPNMTSGHPSITRKNRWCRCQETTNTQDARMVTYDPGLVSFYNAMRQISLLIIRVVITINIHDCVTLCWQALSLSLWNHFLVSLSQKSLVICPCPRVDGKSGKPVCDPLCTLWIRSRQKSAGAELQERKTIVKNRRKKCSHCQS